MPFLAPFLGFVIVGTITVGQVLFVMAMMMYGQWQASKARKAAKDAYNASLKDRLVTVATTTATRSRVYGRVRNVDGVLFKASHGPDSRYYTFVIAVAGHEIDGFERAYFNDIPLELSSDGWVQTAPYATTKFDTKQVQYSGTGTVTLVLPSDPVVGSVSGVSAGQNQDHMMYETATIVSVVGRTVTLNESANGAGYGSVAYQVLNSNSRARIRFYNGTPTQDLSGDLVALGIPNIQAGVHRFAGIACMLITLTYDTDAFQTGLPQFSATVRGAKCFDRRTGLTAFTANPAVIADDWCQYRYGGNLALGEVDADILIASANACDVMHDFSAAKTGQASLILTMPMYTCGMVCKTEADPSETLNAIVESMAGQWGWAAGKLRMKAGMYTAPVTTIDESWLSGQGSLEFNQGLAQNDLVNIYNPQIADANQNFLVVPTAPVRAEPYITADGRELPVSLTLEAVTDVVHAQHVCGVMLRHSRQGFTASLPCNFKGIRLELFDTIALNLERYGLVGKTMEIATWSFDQNGGTVMLLREISAGIFDPDAGFKLLDESPNTSLPLPWVVPAITGLALTSGTAVLSDASVVTRTRATWDRVPAESVTQSGKVEVAYYDMATLAAGAEVAWSTIEVAGDATEAVIVGLIAGHPYIFEVRARNSAGVRGPWSVQQMIVVAVPANTAAADAAAAKAIADAAAADAAAAVLDAANAAAAAVIAKAAADQAVLDAAEAKRIADEALAKAAIPGPPGADGQTTYFHVAYANDASGGGFNQTGGTYIGTYVDTTAAASGNPALYRWVLIKGAAGANGTNGIAGTNGVNGQTSYLHIKYSNDGGASFTANAGEDVGAWIGTYVDFTLADSGSLGAYTWARLQPPTYRQEGTPTGTIPEGSVWLVPSTGKQWVYTGGTWYPSVGTASVGTGEIIDHAASNAMSSVVTSKTSSASAATRVTLTSLTITPSGKQICLWAFATPSTVIGSTNDVSIILSAKQGTFGVSVDVQTCSIPKLSLANGILVCAHTPVPALDVFGNPIVGADGDTTYTLSLLSSLGGSVVTMAKAGIMLIEAKK